MKVQELGVSLFLFSKIIIVFAVVVGVVGTVGNRNEFSGCPLMGVGKAVGKVLFFVHGLVHAHQRKQPLNECGFPWFPQRFFGGYCAEMFIRASFSRQDSRSV